MTTSDALVRQERLAGRVKGLRSRRAPGDRWMLVVGGLLMPLGALFVILGWVGASRSVLVFEQIPYVVSGGLLGLALVVAGGFVYFAYWLTLLVRETRSARGDLQSVLLRMEALLQDSVQPRLPRAAGASYQGEFVATRTGTMLHRPDCVAVDGRDNLRVVDATTPGLTSCRLCDPLVPARGLANDAQQQGHPST